MPGRTIPERRSETRRPHKERQTPKRKNMGHIFYLIGKSACGKDTLFQKLMERHPELCTYVMYSTRPIRPGERDGVQYHFVTEERLSALSAEGAVIEKRVYQTVCGPWSYATVDDGQIDLSAHDYLIGSGTLVSFQALRNYYGAERVVPLYLESDDGERLIRSVRREQRAAHPNYPEICRRFLADEADFSAEKLARAGIRHAIRNDNLDECLQELEREIMKRRT